MLPLSALFALIPLKLLVLFIVSKGTLRGELKPNRISLMLWSLPSIISFCIAFIQGATFSALPLLMAGLAPLFVLFLSFVTHHRAWKIRPADYASGLVSVAAIILWLVVDNPFLAVVFTIIADICAGIPTFYKTWVAPETELPSVYLLGAVGVVIGLATLQAWSFETAGFSIYLLLFDLFMVFLAIHKTVARYLKRFV